MPGHVVALISWPGTVPLCPLPRRAVPSFGSQKSKNSIWAGAADAEDHMITESFNSRTMANMEVALERACLLLPVGSEKHRARRIIASKIIECANRGDTALGRLTEAGYAAVMQLTASGRPHNSVRKVRPTTDTFTRTTTPSPG